MKRYRIFAILLVFAHGICSQSVDDALSQKKMKKDLEVFKQIRLQANSGLYKYRSKEQLDSTYNWAKLEVEKAENYLDLYNIICQLTDYEGSLHNNTTLSEKHAKSLREETGGYFPYPIKWVDGKWLINLDGGEVPLGAEIVSINGNAIEDIMDNLNKYYPTDGANLTGKRIGMRTHFSRYFRWHYGLKDTFDVAYKSPRAENEKKRTINSVGFRDYYKNFNTRHSKPLDQIYYANLKAHQMYDYEQLDAATGLLTIYSFGIGENEDSEEHKTYAAFLDRVFADIKDKDLKNLIIDVRQCSGGNDPNDVLTYSYLTTRNFQESKQVWNSFQKLPLLKHYNSSIPKFLRPFGVGKYNRQFKRRFPIEKDGKYFIGKDENEMKVWEPNENAFTGKIYILISPAVASAGSLFAAMVVGNDNSIAIGEESMGGYYGHNGHTPLEYVLPNSKIVTEFFIENIEQDVPVKKNQKYNRGIMPDYEVSQSLEDFLNNEDTQMRFVLELINSKNP